MPKLNDSIVVEGNITFNQLKALSVDALKQEMGNHTYIPTRLRWLNLYMGHMGFFNSPDSKAIIKYGDILLKKSQWFHCILTYKTGIEDTPAAKASDQRVAFLQEEVTKQKFLIFLQFYFRDEKKDLKEISKLYKEEIRKLTLLVLEEETLVNRLATLQEAKADAHNSSFKVKLAIEQENEFINSILATNNSDFHLRFLNNLFQESNSESDQISNFAYGNELKNLWPANNSYYPSDKNFYSHELREKIANQLAAIDKEAEEFASICDQFNNSEDTANINLEADSHLTVSAINLIKVKRGLERIQAKIGELNEYADAQNALTDIYNLLNNPIQQFVEDGNQHQLQHILSKNIQEVNSSLPKLEHYPGWKKMRVAEVVINLLAAIGTLFIGYGIGAAITGRLMLFRLDPRDKAADEVKQLMKVMGEDLELNSANENEESAQTSSDHVFR